MKETIPLLVTLDVHSYPQVEKEIPLWFEETLKRLAELAIQATFFFPALAAEKYAGFVKTILKQGHEIGCHSLAHTPDEQYNLMSYGQQKSKLAEAKKRIEQVAGEEIICFRAPAFKINGNTIRALEECGFKADSSINPQRLGILSSEITNIGWIYSPRRPYHPSFSNPFKAAKKPTPRLWEIPQSALIFPFMSYTGIAFGEAVMDLFFRLLYFEARWRKNPIIYLFHPEDIYPKRELLQYRFQWRHLLPSKKKGFRIRHVFFHNKSPEKIARQISNLFKTMKSANSIEFIAFREMLTRLENT